MRANLLKQKQVPLLGAINQVLGGAIGWVGMFTFLFSAITAWNTPTLNSLRQVFPWLNIVTFIAFIIAGICLAMLVQHKYVQPSAVNYWRKMFYDQNPSEERLKRMEEQQSRIERMLEELMKERVG